jgi:hypothetical protein
MDETNKELTEEAEALSKELKSIDMTGLWREYSINVKGHLRRNRETRRRNWEEAMRNPK